QPAACIFFCQAMRFSRIVRSGEMRWSCASSTFRSSVRLASSHSCSSRRNSACSGESAKSIAGPPFAGEGTEPRSTAQCRRTGLREQVLDAVVDDPRNQRVGARPQMQHVDKMLAEVRQVLGGERGENVDYPN